MIKGKVVVGILPTYNLKNEDNDPYQDKASFVRMYEQRIIEAGAIPIGLLNNNIENYFDICDAYVWPGGNSIQKDFYKVFEDAIKNHKPFLGICLGMQAMATYFNILEDNKKNKELSFYETYEANKESKPYLVRLEEEKISNHSHYVTKDEETINNAKHIIKIEKGTIMDDIYKTDTINVPSMHTYIVARVPKSLTISSRTEDGTIESVEYTKNGACMLGVQYHPELIKDYKIFNWLVERSLDKYKILVNKEYKIPNNLYFKIVTYDSKCPSIDKRESLMEESVYYAFLELKKAMQEKGYEIDLQSGYRYTIDQEELFNRIVEEKGIEHTNMFVAKPRHSEHETGLAIDVCACIDGKWNFESDEELNILFSYLHSIISDYGFILRYPKGKEDITGYGYEPWHLRYVGSKEFAKEIMDNNLTLEEASNSYTLRYSKK